MVNEVARRSQTSDAAAGAHRPAAVAMHRSIWRLHLPRHRLLTAVAIAAAFTIALLSSRQWIGTSWSAELVWWLRQLDLPGRFEMPSPEDQGLVGLPVPTIDMRLHFDGIGSVLQQGLACAIVWMLAGSLPDSAKPGVYLVRFALLIHALSLVYFAFWPASFPHGLASHIDAGLRQSWALMVLTPALHLFTYYLFPFSSWRRVALTGLALIFVFVLTPLQYACHAALLHALGLVAMPILYLLFGTVVPILGMVALYGWAMSWDPPRSERVPAAAS